jgi:hypothetical protein
LFAWFGSTKSKSRINFLRLLRAGHEDYRVDEEALAYMQAQKLPHAPLERLRTHSDGLFSDEAHWNAHLTRLEITQERHRRIATEGTLLGSVLHHGFPKELPIVSDDAGQFKVLCHGLCWVHAERLIHRLVPLNPTHRQELAEVRSQFWALYTDLKAYKEHPSPEKKIDLETRFDALFTIQTSFETLNQTLRRISSATKRSCSWYWTGQTLCCTPMGVNEIFAIPSRNARSVAGPEVTWGGAVGIPS